MTIDMIKTFITLAETKNFNRAAELLFVAQPTISVRIKALEDEMSFPLFVRNNKHVELTTRGIEFLPYAMSLYKSMMACQNFAKGNERYSTHLSISAPVTCWDYGPLRDSVLTFCQCQTDTMINLLRNDSETTYRRLLDNDVDIGVVYLKPLNSDIEYVQYHTEYLYLVTSPAIHLPAYGDFQGLEDDLPPLIRPAYAAIASQLVEESLYMFPCHITSDHPSLYLNMLKSGMGVGLLQSDIANPEIAAGSLSLVDCNYNLHPIPYKNYLAYKIKNKSRLSPLINALLNTDK